MKLSELLFEGIDLSKFVETDAFFINPSKPLSECIIYVVMKDNEMFKEHLDCIKESPELFDLTSNDIAKKDRTEILNMVDNKGWIRGVREATHYFCLQSNNIKNLHKAALILSENIGIETLLIENNNIDGLELQDDKLEYFLKKGKIPEKWLL